jgi:hypothetical protein
MTRATNRRAVLGTVLAAGALAVPTLPAQLVVGIAEEADRVLAEDDPDPVLALVAKVRAAWDRLGEVLEETEEEDRAIAAHRVLDAALAELQKTPPMTLAGAREAIAWLVKYDEPNIPETSGQYLRTLARSPIFVG